MKKYKYVYQLHHNRIVAYDFEENPIYDRKDLGFFSTKQRAIEAVNFFKNLPGFLLYPNDFHIDKIRIYLDEQILNIPDCIYWLIHEYEDSDEECDIINRIGIFVNQSEAEKRKNMLIKQMPYFKYPNNFEILQCNLNEKSEFWSEGFDVE